MPSRSMAFRRALAATWTSIRPISGALRLAEMDEAGITVHVLSASGPGAYLLDGADGVAFARDINDVLAKAVAAHPDRFAGFAHLPMRTARRPRPTSWNGRCAISASAAH